MSDAKKGSFVRYGQVGICEITDVTTTDQFGEKNRYFVLTPLYKTGSVVYVPCDKKELVAKMLPPLTPEETEDAILRAKSTPATWIRDFRKRSEASKRALSSPDRADAILLIKSILIHNKEIMGEGKRIHTTDDYFLRDAEALIGNEFSFVLNRPREEILQEIITRLEI